MSLHVKVEVMLEVYAPNNVRRHPQVVLAQSIHPKCQIQVGWYSLNDDAHLVRPI